MARQEGNLCIHCIKSSCFSTSSVGICPYCVVFIPVGNLHHFVIRKPVCSIIPLDFAMCANAFFLFLGVGGGGGGGGGHEWCLVVCLFLPSSGVCFVELVDKGFL